MLKLFSISRRFTGQSTMARSTADAGRGRGFVEEGGRGQGVVANLMCLVTCSC
ncbi:hypothetical protein HanPI659440_Chr11g0415951 [Helianthus annuus]|nr:hypothetical protein HanPI659440_Chr11g0415951 [Helianthus annuus]